MKIIDGTDCRKCIFHHKWKKCRQMKCTANQREDGRNVIFIKEEKVGGENKEYQYGHIR